ncbi:MAG: ThiF family adenylyltransferase [Pseudomonadota bacterium]|nr:ThiF family adenylyltransferase [Pseudomonadota bacterium]
MTSQFDYDTFVMRNGGYIDDMTQTKIRNTKLLIAGCGIGSGPAVCAARLGFENFILVDGDVVDAHNLNRQFYDFADVGKPKVEALKDKILRINPQAKVEAVQAYLDADNTDAIVGKADIVFDTVDFLDLQAILRLHLSAKKHHVEIFTALSVGFGALVWYFPASSPLSLADLIAPDIERVRAAGGGDASSYVDVFAAFIGRLVPYLDSEVTEQITEVLTRMKDGKPCPASQVAVGSFSIGAMAVSMIHDLLSGRPVVAAPQLVLHSFKRHLSQVVDITA